jgi:hypothetical protein
MSLPRESEVLAEQVSSEFVHALFPSFHTPAFLACPDDQSAKAVLAAITRAAGARGVAMEVIDLRPAPAQLIDAVTKRLCESGNRRERKEAPAVRVLVLDGFDLLEGAGHDGPTYPFRSEFQFDQDFRWLFMGRDWCRLRRMFGTYRLPLFHAASDITPELWRARPN